MMPSFEPFKDFQVASADALKYLHQRFGFALWMVTRTEGEDWIVLTSEDHGYNVKDGDVFRWTDSFCSQMVQGFGPFIAPRSNLVPAYASAPIGQQVPIAAYIGLPLMKPDGTLFGTLCAIDKEVQSDALTNELPQLELISRMLGSILASELKAESEMRRAERAEAESESDSLTGLYNRRGWDRLLAAEESRCQRYGHAAAVLSVDLDGFKEINDHQGHSCGDLMLKKAANALNQAIRDGDVLARVGGDEFAVLAIHCDQPTANELAERITNAFDRVELKASIGVASRDPSKSLSDAWVLADQAMFELKRTRKRSREYQPTELVTSEVV